MSLIIAGGLDSTAFKGPIQEKLLYDSTDSVSVVWKILLRMILYYPTITHQAITEGSEQSLTV